MAETSRPHSEFERDLEFAQYIVKYEYHATDASLRQLAVALIGLKEQLEALQQENYSLRGQLADWQAAWRREETAKLEAVANSNPASEPEAT